MKKIILFIYCLLMFSISFCQENMIYYKAQDTVGFENSVDYIVLEKGLKLNNKRVGLWVGMYSDTNAFYSALLYVNDENQKDTLSDNLLYRLFDNKGEQVFSINDTILNIFYMVSNDSVGRIKEKYLINSDSLFDVMYNSNGTIRYYLHSDFKTKIEYIYDEDGILKEYYIKKEVGLKSKNFNTKGELISKGKLKNDLPHGVWKTYKNNKVVKIEKYRDGILLSRKTIFT